MVSSAPLAQPQRLILFVEIKCSRFHNVFVYFLCQDANGGEVTGAKAEYESKISSCSWIWQPRVTMMKVGKWLRVQSLYPCRIACAKAKSNTMQLVTQHMESSLNSHIGYTLCYNMVLPDHVATCTHMKLSCSDSASQKCLCTESNASRGGEAEMAIAFRIRSLHAAACWYFIS